MSLSVLIPSQLAIRFQGQNFSKVFINDKYQHLIKLSFAFLADHSGWP